ncbi:hypothetical protein ATO13_22691 [Stappia sp. 22II-S9-Z10]|nr:hypothetical protein ATO13_22691 [Stappia sp. 22II-S9-Z10]
MHIIQSRNRAPHYAALIAFFSCVGTMPASAAEIALGEPLGVLISVIGTGLTAAGLIGAYALMERVGIEKKSTAGKLVERMIVNGLNLASDQAALLARNVTVEIDNPRVAGAVGYVLAQGTQAIKAAKTNEAEIVRRTYAMLPTHVQSQIDRRTWEGIVVGPATDESEEDEDASRTRGKG